MRPANALCVDVLVDKHSQRRGSLARSKAREGLILRYCLLVRHEEGSRVIFWAVQ